MPAFLRAVKQMPHRIEVEDDLARVLGQTPRAQLEQTGFDLLWIVRQLVAAGVAVVGEFEAVERGRRRQRRAAIRGTEPVLAERVGVLAGDGQERIAAQLIVIIEVFVTEGERFDALGEQGFEVVLDEAGVALIVEASGQRPGEAEAAIDLAQQQHAAVGGERAAREIGDDAA
jgi:hypothetical protein